MAEIISLQGPVERVNGKLRLRIPLSQGADQLAAYTRGIGQIVGEYLEITIPEWLAGMLRIEHGSLVIVDNENNKFNMQPVNPLPSQ